MALRPAYVASAVTGLALLALAAYWSTSPAPVAVAQPSPTPAPGATESVQLFATCNNVSLTWTAGTPISAVAAGVSPSGALMSIFRYDNVSGRFFGYSPNAPDFANDYQAVATRLEPVFICMSGPGTLTRPAA